MLFRSSWACEIPTLNSDMLRKVYPHSVVNGELQSFFGEHLLSNNISMWKSIYDSYKLFNNYQNRPEQRKYDYVIRARTDVFPEVNLRELINLIDQNNVIVVPETFSHPRNEINDWFAMGTNVSMAKYSELFNSVDEIILECLYKYNYWTNEAGLKLHLDRNGLEVVKIPLKMKFK